MTEAFNMDCMAYMATLPDGAFDLAVVDPPYGSGETADTHTAAQWNRFGGIFDKYKPSAHEVGGRPAQERELEPVRRTI